MKEILVVIGIIAFIGLAIYIPIYRWKECRRVHTFFYCFTSK